METAYGDKKFTVCIYELLGTATLMLAVVMTGGNALYVCFTLWAILMISGGITGGHFNPAVSTGVFIWQRKYDEHFALYSAVVASQFAGALLGMMTGYLLIGNFTDEWYEEHPDGAVPSEWVPVFAPQDPLSGGYANRGRGWSTFLTQTICTTIFVFIILINKTPGKGKPSEIPALNCLSIALALYAMIHVAVRNGACFNPAVGFAGTLYSVFNLEQKGNQHYAYVWAYILGPLAGGAIAGFLNIEHEKNVSIINEECDEKMSKVEEYKGKKEKGLLDDQEIRE